MNRVNSRQKATEEFSVAFFLSVIVLVLVEVHHVVYQPFQIFGCHARLTVEILDEPIVYGLVLPPCARCRRLGTS